MHHDAVWPQRDWFWISSAIKQTLFRMRPCEGKWPWLSALNFSRDVHIISSPVVANIIMGHVPHKILPGYCHALPSLWRSSPGSAYPWSSRYPWDDTAQSEFRPQKDPPRRTKLGKLCQMILIQVWKIPQISSNEIKIKWIDNVHNYSECICTCGPGKSYCQPKSCACFPKHLNPPDSKKLHSNPVNFSMCPVPFECNCPVIMTVDPGMFAKYMHVPFINDSSTFLWFTVQLQLTFTWINANTQHTSILMDTYKHTA